MASSFAQQFKRSGPPVLSDADRKQASVLVVEPEASMRNSLRQMLVRLGIGQVSDAPDHLQALKKFEERRFTHVIFEAKKTSMPSGEFLAKLLDLDDTTVAIPSSWDPSVDDVFGLLTQGARGYLVKPFTEISIDESMIMATKGEPIADAILFAKDRNEALAALVMTQVDKLAITLRQSQHFETARRDLPRRVAGLRRAIDIGKTFARGGPESLVDAMIEFCLERSNGPATRLGRLRKRLVAKKQPKPGDPPSPPQASPPPDNVASMEASSTSEQTASSTIDDQGITHETASVDGLDKAEHQQPAT
jgi:two-component system chemotaxis response regulator CheY